MTKNLEQEQKKKEKNSVPCNAKNISHAKVCSGKGVCGVKEVEDLTGASVQKYKCKCNSGFKGKSCAFTDEEFREFRNKSKKLKDNLNDVTPTKATTRAVLKQLNSVLSIEYDDDSNDEAQQSQQHIGGFIATLEKASAFIQSTDQVVSMMESMTKLRDKATSYTDGLSADEVKKRVAKLREVQQNTLQHFAKSLSMSKKRACMGTGAEETCLDFFSSLELDGSGAIQT